MPRRTHPTQEDAFPRPISPYGVTKLACESLARTYAEFFSLETVVLSYFTLYGPRQRYVADAVDATIAAMEGGPGRRIYNVGGGSETTLKQAFALFERLAERRLDVHYEPTAAGDMRRTAADTNLIRSELGWVPRVSLEDGIAAQLAAAT
jgi:UDP-glucuronate 4-epimerase